jgi:predicted DCC family thiol-disulfide oxidoreductase YuxK
MTEAVTAVFDGRCVICQGTRSFVRALDWRGRVGFLDLHDRETVAQRYPSLDHDVAMGEIHVFDRAGRVYVGFAGTRRMLRELPLMFPVWLLLHLPGMMWLGARLYRWVARRRYAVNRLFGVDLAPCEDTCRV